MSSEVYSHGSDMEGDEYLEEIEEELEDSECDEGSTSQASSTASTSISTSASIVEDEDSDASESEIGYEQSRSGKFKGKISGLLSSAFSKEQSGGDFVGYGALLNAPNAGLYITGLGLISSPLDNHNAEKIIERADQAPFDRKEKSWQIGHSKIRFRNPEWVKYMTDSVVPEVAERLGVKSDQIDTKFNKLILYTKGCQQEAHQNQSGKKSGIFGTLFIILPSHFKGGGISVSHGSNEVDLDTASNSEFGTSFLCIFSKVFHRVNSIKSGYQLALCYNLIFSSKSEPKPEAPLPNPSLEELRKLLEEWPEQLHAGKNLPKFIAHILDRRNTKVGLDFANIEGRDKAKLRFMKGIAEKSCFEVYIAQLNITVEGTCDIDDDDDFNPNTHPRRNCRCKIDHRYSPSYSLEDAFDKAGNEVDLSYININRRDATPPINTRNWRPDLREHDEYNIAEYFYKTIMLLCPKNEMPSTVTSIPKGKESGTKDSSSKNALKALEPGNAGNVSSSRKRNVDKSKNTDIAIPPKRKRKN